MEVKEAKNWYLWLWLSPLLTIPTLFFVSFITYYRFDERTAFLIGVLCSALWHLILLIPSRNKKSEFIAWHGRQAILLAGIRTLIPLGYGFSMGGYIGNYLGVPLVALIALWFFGTLWGQQQATHGDCSLMRWMGRGDLLPLLEEIGDKPSPAQDPEVLVDIIRFSQDVELRQNALKELEELGLVEGFDR